MCRMILLFYVIEEPLEILNSVAVIFTVRGRISCRKVFASAIKVVVKLGVTYWTSNPQ